MALRQVRRLDLGELRPATVRDDGTVRVDAFITRCGIFNYLQPDGTVRRELRLPEEVFDSKSLASFDGVPVTNDHPPEMITASNAKKYAVGSLQGGVTRDDDHLRGHLAVYDGDTIDAMRDRGRRQVSVGYVCDLEEKPGVHPQYGQYDAIQRCVRANHLAIVDSARAGSTARVRLDAAESMDAWSDEAREASAEARKGGAKAPAQVAAEIAQHGKDYEARKKIKPAKMSKEAARAEFEKLRAAPQQKAEAEFARLRAEKTRKSRNAELAKYVMTKKDCGIYGMPRTKGDSADALDSCKIHATVGNMADEFRADAEVEKNQGGSPKKGDPDPKDEASRNASGDNDAKAKDKAKKPGAAEEESLATKDAAGEEQDPEDPEDTDSDDPDDDGDDDSDSDDRDDDDDMEGDEPHDDAYTASYDEDGELTAEARHKLSTSNFAVPDREGLPIHDPEHTRAAMSRFGQYDFKKPEEKHAAFNRVVKRAKQFGISSDGFEKSHKNTLDRQDNEMTNPVQMQKLQTERDAAVKRADAADAALAKAEGQIASLKKDIEKASTRIDAADVQNQVDSKLALVLQAKETGAKVDSKMSAVEIKRAVIKHVDGEDAPEGKPEAYIDALFDGAVKRAHKDAQDYRDGEEALTSVRAAAVRPENKNDSEDDLDEEGARERALDRASDAWTKPFGKTKEIH